MNVDDIMSKVREYNCKFVEITGGEPLTHTNINNLIKHFLDKNYLVAIETNGSIPINTLPRNVIKILDIKCPDSGMSEFNDYNNLNYITFLDEIKFVIASKADFDWFEIIYNEYKLFEVTANIVLSAVQEGISNKELAELILNSKYRNMIRMQLQLHKIIWDANARGR
jgi:7-carboxy-7-deazaguanine synthase